MANMTRFDPFADPFEDLVRRMVKPVRWEGDPQPLQIKVDVEESDKATPLKQRSPVSRRKTSTCRSKATRFRSAPRPSRRRT